jgi:hypothetical protein
MQYRPEHDQEQPQSRSPDVATRRIEAFSDGVFASAITLLALNLHVPPNFLGHDDHPGPASVSSVPGSAVAHLPELRAQFRDAAHRMGLPSPAAPRGEPCGKRTPLHQWAPLAHRVVGSLPNCSAGRIFGHASSLSGVCHIRRLYWRPQPHLQRAVVAGGAAADRPYRRAYLRWLPAPRAGVAAAARHSSTRLASPDEHAAVVSRLGFPCYVVAVGIAFWSPVATLVICGVLWVVWTIMAPMLAAE